MLALAELPEAYHALCDYLALDDGIPYVEKWSAAADFLQLLIDHVNSTGPSQILECGSGLTTIILAAACNRLGDGHIVTLEQEQEYVLRIQQVLDHYMLADRVEVIHAPLCTYQVDGKTYQWYSLDALPDVSADMLVIDGPPGMIQQHSRYPALPLLADHLSHKCHIFLDDAARQDEREVVEQWARLPDVSLEDYIDLERGCAHLVSGART